MIRYIASDLDGTLLPDNGKDMNPQIFELILRLKEKGVHFIAASGRQYQSMRRLFRPIQDEISYISENGALCIHDGQVICRGLIERELGLRIIEAGRECNQKYGGCHSLLSCESKHFTDSRDERFIRHMRDVIHNEFEVVDNLRMIQEPFLKLSICNFNGTDILIDLLKQRFSSEIKITAVGALWVDFIAPDANKGTSLNTLLSTLNINPKDGIAFGDQYNDVEMLKLAGTSYAMTTAAPGVSDYADYLTDSPTDVLKEILKSLD